MGERASGKWDTGSEAWTNVPKYKPKLGLYRRQAERHGMQTSDWGREPEREKVPSFKDITSAMSPGQKGKRFKGFDYSNMQPRGGRR